MVEKSVTIGDRVVNIANFKKNWNKYCNKEISRMELCSRYQVSEPTIYYWRDIIYKNKISKSIIPTNFKEKYMRYYKDEIKHYELCKELEVSAPTVRKWAHQLNLPKKNSTTQKSGTLERTHIPSNFEKEYMKYYNNKIKRTELLAMFDINQDTYYKWRKILNLPVFDINTRGIRIPENFKEEYMRYYNGEIRNKELCKKFNVSEATIRVWRISLNLPIVDCRTNYIKRRAFLLEINSKNQKKKIPENFKEEYMKYYNREIQQKELLENFGINRTQMRKWRDTLMLPVIDTNIMKIPENFQRIYISFLNGEISKEFLLKKLNVSEVTICRWRDKCSLPLAQGARRYSLGKPASTKSEELVLSQPTTVSVEPSVQVINKPTFSFSLFGYKFSFTAKKEKPPKPVNIADKFPDEIEY